jgi:hypothetical protein
VIHYDFNIEYLKEKYPPNSKVHHYPNLIAPRKTGCPPNATWLAVEKPGCEDGWAVGGSHPWNCAGSDGG